MSILKRITKKTIAAQVVETAVTADSTVKAVETVAKKPVAKKVAFVSATTARTLLAPLVTEKTAHLADAGVYAFLVPVNANRVAVGQAFRELYKVTPVKVNIIRVHGKEHRFAQVTSRQSDWKKALVSVPKGTRVDIFEKI